MPHPRLHGARRNAEPSARRSFDRPGPNGVGKCRYLAGEPDVIDLFSLALTHALLLLAAWRLASRAELDSEPPPGA